MCMCGWAWDMQGQRTDRGTAQTVGRPVGAQNGACGSMGGGTVAAAASCVLSVLFKQFRQTASGVYKTQRQIRLTGYPKPTNASSKTAFHPLLPYDYPRTSGVPQSLLVSFCFLLGFRHDILTVLLVAVIICPNPKWNNTLSDLLRSKGSGVLQAHSPGEWQCPAWPRGCSSRSTFRLFLLTSWDGHRLDALNILLGWDCTSLHLKAIILVYWSCLLALFKMHKFLLIFYYNMYNFLQPSSPRRWAIGSVYFTYLLRTFG